MSGAPQAPGAGDPARAGIDPSAGALVGAQAKEMRVGEVRGGSGAMFDAIAGRYDLVNRVISLGLDQSWRRRAVAALELDAAEPPARVLDLATGTGDLALRIARTHARAEVVGIDPSAGMLAVAERKAARAGLGGRVRFQVGDAEALPLEDAGVAAVTIAFGIRNVPDRLRALREMRRVVRPGGKVAVLELGEPRAGLLGAMARFHIRSVVPRVGAFLSGAAEYRYLERSIAAFPEPEAFAELMRAAGLSEVRVQALSFGVSHLYVGTRPRAEA